MRVVFLEDFNMNNVISKLFRLRKALDECERELGLNDYSEVERAVFSFVTSNVNVTITSIKNEPYFSKYSLSTIKRSVLSLISNGVIKSEQSLVDKREMLLTLPN